MPIFLLSLLACIACERYETPPLPAFSDDKISYEQVLKKKNQLKEKFEKKDSKDLSL